MKLRLRFSHNLGADILKLYARISSGAGFSIPVKVFNILLVPCSVTSSSVIKNTFLVQICS